MGVQNTIFDIQARVGITKHLGGQDATEEIIRLCEIENAKHILDVGAGTGFTAVYIAKKYGIKVTGIDLSEKMVAAAQARAKREKVEELTDFRTADVQELPFDDSTFDAVICESVLAFPADKQKAVNQMARVLKPGKFLGINEGAWIKKDPPEDVAAWVAQDLSHNARLLTHEEWTLLLVNAGLKELFTRPYKITMKQEAKRVISRYGLKEMIGAWGKSFSIFFRERQSREILKESIKMPKDALKYFGYGIYIGRK